MEKPEFTLDGSHGDFHKRMASGGLGTNKGECGTWITALVKGMK